MCLVGTRCAKPADVKYFDWDDAKNAKLRGEGFERSRTPVRNKAATRSTRGGYWRGRVVLKAHDKDGHAVIEVADECGGIPESTGDPFQSFGEQRGRDRTGLGLGLAIARKAVRAHGGDIYIRNTPGKGCVFSIEVPLAAADTSAASAVV